MSGLVTQPQFDDSPLEPHLPVPESSVSLLFHSATFEFQHNICGREIYAEGTVDAVLFLAKKVRA